MVECILSDDEKLGIVTDVPSSREKMYEISLRFLQIKTTMKPRKKIRVKAI